ncbi:MAG: glycosyltransferase, partial [Candidatus Omnitrophica bacterium]|nr:glycosyltransferase [Candidatus Omnitrophota bacterium]
MNVIQRIRFPQDEEIQDLYVRTFGPIGSSVHVGSGEVFLGRGGAVSLDTYFNSFYEQYYVNHTGLRAVYYVLNLEGDFLIQVYRERYEAPSQFLCVFEARDCQRFCPVKVILPELETGQHSGRIFLKMTCQSERGWFGGGVLATDQERERDVHLGVIICTFQREAEVKAIVDVLLNDNDLKGKDWTLWLIDNGRTLDDQAFKDSRVQIVPNRNCGGSGGFARGLMEGCRDSHATHFLLLDDDIQLDSESIFRLFAIYEYAKEDLALAGSMFYLGHKNQLTEAGGQWQIQGVNQKFLGLKHDLYLKTAEDLNYLLVEEKVNCGGFWFFGFPRVILEKIGLPMPFFIGCDDREYGMRIKARCGGKIVPFPSLAVWHEMYMRHEILISRQAYYRTRNMLIVQSIYRDRIEFFGRMLKDVLRAIFLFDYDFARLYLKAAEDFLKGPGFLKTKDPEELHHEIAGLRSKPLFSKDGSGFSDKSFQKPTPMGFLATWIRLATLNGHLLPDILLKEDPVSVSSEDFPAWRKAFRARKTRIYIYESTEGAYYENVMDK